MMWYRSRPRFCKQNAIDNRYFHKFRCCRNNSTGFCLITFQDRRQDKSECDHLKYTWRTVWFWLFKGPINCTPLTISNLYSEDKTLYRVRGRRVTHYVLKKGEKMTEMLKVWFASVGFFCILECIYSLENKLRINWYSIQDLICTSERAFLKL